MTDPVNDPMTDPMTNEVIFTVENGVGRIRLNRPRQIHALTHPMCAAMIAHLLAWRDDIAVRAVMIDHAEGRGFCAGGDVRMLAASGAADGIAARAFFGDEYRLNHLLFTYVKPIVAFMDGITMGGGVGISMPARHRIVTPRTMFAMPETTIGLFPDVGGGWYLSRLPGRTGQFVGLTGARLDGAECLALGIGTAYVAGDVEGDVASDVEALKAAIVADPAALAETIAQHAAPPPPARILANRDAIDRLFASDRFEDILDALAADPSDWAAKELATLRAKSPQACKVTLRLLRDGAARASFADEMRAEYALAAHIGQRPDFIEGVRALLIDKDNAPRWNPATPEGVTDPMLDTLFAPLPEDEAWTPC
jgi:enoyl-CoA hydratase